MPKYSTYDEEGKLAWFVRLAQWLKDNGENHGFTAPEIAALNMAAGNATSATAGNKAAQETARNATAAKKAAITELIRLGRDAALRLQCNEQTTDKDREEAGLTIPPAVAMLTDDIADIPTPKLHIEFCANGEVAIHWGPNPENRRGNAKPTGVLGCAVEIAASDIPVDDSFWVPLDPETRSPIRYTPDVTGPIAYAYRARYILKRKLTLGPFSEPVLFPERVAN